MSPAATLTYEQVKQEEKRLLTSIAAEYNASVSTISADVSFDALRWFPIGDPNSPRAIAVVKRGKPANGKKSPDLVKTISKTNTPDLWESWLPVLAEWQDERKRTNKRTDHNKLTKGKLL